MVRSAAVALGLALLSACTNNPYPDADEALKILYQPLGEPPRTLDPAVSYNAAEHQITGIVYATLLDYHYLARPYRLIPALAREVPRARRASRRSRRLPLPASGGRRSIKPIPPSRWAGRVSAPARWWPATSPSS